MLEVLQPYLLLMFGPLAFLAILNLIGTWVVNRREKRVIREMEYEDDN